MFSPGIQQLLDRLRPHKGEFEIPLNVSIRHKTAVADSLNKCCPMAFLVGPGTCGNADYRTFQESFGLTSDEVSDIVCAADANCSEGYLGDLRRALLEACL
jgi:hypothetical protein